MKIILSSLLITITWVLHAQPKMYEGVIVDHHEEIILTKMIAETAFNVLIYKSQVDTATSVILPAHRIKSFRYFDSIKNINRQFISIRNEGIHRFYEVVIYGEVQVIRRLKRNVRSWEADEGHDYDYFCWFRNNLIDLKKFRKSVVPVLVQNYGFELENFISNNKLYLRDAASIFLVVKKCNQLNSRNSLVAIR